MVAKTWVVPKLSQSIEVVKLLTFIWTAHESVGTLDGEWDDQAGPMAISDAVRAASPHSSGGVNFKVLLVP